MESRFDTNDFERSLREHADKFFLTPSDRVWKSIYNDLHPGSKWPSLGVGIILLISLFWIGNTHTSTVNPIASKVIEESTTPVKGEHSESLLPSSVQTQSQPETKQQTPSKTSIVEQTVLLPVAGNILKRNGEQPSENTQLPTGKIEKPDNQFLVLQQVINIPEINSGIHSNISSKSLVDINNILGGNNGKLVASDELQSSDAPKLKPVEVVSQNKQLSKVPPLKHRQLKKAEWTLFVTPERGNVHFEGSNLNKPAQSLVATNPVAGHKVNTHGRFGFQAGADVNYKLTGSIDFTSGFHLSYNGYNIMAELSHPSLSSVTFRDSKGNLFTKNYMSYYGNSNNGSLKITNYNMQFAIPVGLQWTLFEEDNVKVSVVSTVEPFLVLGSQAYILSGDGKKFVNDPDLIRRVNLNGTFGSVVTFSSHNINWNIGPSIRYQVLSTYQNIYPIREHLINYGLRIGISKPR